MGREVLDVILPSESVTFVVVSDLRKEKWEQGVKGADDMETRDKREGRTLHSTPAQGKVDI